MQLPAAIADQHGVIQDEPHGPAVGCGNCFCQCRPRWTLPVQAYMKGKFEVPPLVTKTWGFGYVEWNATDILVSVEVRHWQIAHQIMHAPRHGDVFIWHEDEPY
eukprot:364300-Chlamydomonas_euryale.AAC.3